MCSKYYGNTERGVIVFFWETSLKEKCELSLKGWKIFLNIKSRERKIIGKWAANLKEGKQKKVFFRELHKDLHVLVQCGLPLEGMQDFRTNLESGFKGCKGSIFLKGKSNRSFYSLYRKYCKIVVIGRSERKECK